MKPAQMQASLKSVFKFLLLLMMAVSISACSKSWEEEVQLHDGQKILVSRSVEHGGRHELFKDPSISEQRLAWRMPGTGQRITWEDHYSADVGSATLLPMLVDVHQGEAYVVANPMGCLAYNKWGRPNPPYVVFKYQDKEWKHIPLHDLPAEIKTPNLILSMPDEKAKQIGKNPVPSEAIQKIVRDTLQPEYKNILRAPVTKGSGGTSCEELFPDGKGGWLGIGWFQHPTKEACAQFCAREKIADRYCICIIKEKK